MYPYYGHYLDHVKVLKISDIKIKMNQCSDICTAILLEARLELTLFWYIASCFVM